MAQVQDAPIYDDLMEGFPIGKRPVDADLKPLEFNGKPKLSWILFFQNMLRGDIGTSWSPVVTNLGATGTPTITGNYYQNLGFADFFVQIVPGTDTTSTAGTTYIDLPFDVTVNGACFAVSGGTGSSAGMVDAATNRAYLPGWSAVTVPVTITGRVVTP